MAYDLPAVAKSIDESIGGGCYSLAEICGRLQISRTTAHRALHVLFNAPFRQRVAFWQSKHVAALKRQPTLTGKEVAARLGYATPWAAARRIRQLGSKVGQS